MQAATAAGRRVPEIENLILPQGSWYPEEGGVREYRSIDDYPKWSLAVAAGST